MLASLAGGLSVLALGPAGKAQGPSAARRAKLGLVTYCLDIRQKSSLAQGGGSQPWGALDFLEECRRLGAGGMQFPLGAKQAPFLAELRRKAEQYEMHLEATVELPRAAADLERFEGQLLAAKQAGATVARTVMLPGRRYEQFDSADEFKLACERGLKSLQLAEPVAARHRVRLAVENHKDHRVQEKLEVLKRLSSEYVGLCVDVANNVALLEDPMAVIQAFAPWALTVHIKDQAIREYAEGFWLADVALGAGFLELPAMVKLLRQARPEVRFNLEVITRDPIKVPVLTPKYWATMPGVPGADLARTLCTVKAKSPKEPLRMVNSLPAEQQIEFEQKMVEDSLTYAREHLEL